MNFFVFYGSYFTSQPASCFNCNRGGKTVKFIENVRVLLQISIEKPETVGSADAFSEHIDLHKVF